MRHLYPTLDGHIRRVYVRCPGKLFQVDEGHQHLAIEANLSAHRMDAKHHWTSKCWFRENPLHEETSPYLTMLLQRPQVFVSNPLGTLSKRRHKLAAECRRFYLFHLLLRCFGSKFRWYIHSISGEFISHRFNLYLCGRLHLKVLFTR